MRQENKCIKKLVLAKANDTSMILLVYFGDESTTRHDNFVFM